MASVRAHGNRIAVRIKVEGEDYVTTINIKPTKTGLDAAKRSARKADSRLRAGEDWASVRLWLRGETTHPTRSLGYFAQHFLDHADVEGSTLREYEYTYNNYWSIFDERVIDTLTRTELEARLASFDIGRKTQRNVLSVLRKIFLVAKRDKVISDAPTDDWEIKKGQDAEPDPYTEVERDKLLKVLERWPMAWRYFFLGFHTGMRTNELIGLEWSAMDRPYINVTQGRVRGQVKHSTKTDKRRKVAAPSVVWDMLDANPTKFQRSFVFLSPDNRPLLRAKSMMRYWAEAHRLANVRKRQGMYPWRSTYISLGLAAGQPLIWMSKQTGHNMLTMQTHYARWIRGREEADLAELERVYPNRATNGATKTEGIQ